MPPAQLDNALAQLVGKTGADLPPGGTPPDAEYTFKHALVQDAAYDTPCSKAVGRNCTAR